MHRNWLKGSAISALVLGASLTTALAADMPLKAPPMVAPVTQWDGVYFGFDTGVGWTHPDTWVFVTDPAVTVALPGGHADWAVGLHAGFNWQFGSFVFGPEASGTWINNGASSEVTCFGSFTCQQSTHTLVTAGGRAGFAWNSWLLYGSGGYAAGTIDTQLITKATGVALDTSSNFHNGWYAGGGVEWALSQIVRFGVDYKHIVLQDATDPIPLNPLDTRTVGGTVDLVMARISIRTWIGGY